MKSRNIYICVAVAFLSLNSCTDSWLEPKPLSFHTPEDTYVGVDGFEATLSACEAEMHDEYNGDGCAILTEMIQSDICVEGTTDKAGPQMDMDKSLLPDMPLDNMDYTRVGWYWTHGYKAIKSANIIIARIDEGKFANEEDKKIECMEKAVLEDGFFAKTFSVNRAENTKMKVKELPAEVGEVSDTFQCAFENSGIMKDGIIYTMKTVPDYHGKQITLGDVMETGQVEEQYFIPEEKLYYTDPAVTHSDETEQRLPKEDRQTWQYLKGAKKLLRTSSTGHEYVFSEGAISMIDQEDKPARTMLTSEGGFSRTTHIVKDKVTGRIRLLTATEAERIQGFPTDHTKYCLVKGETVEMPLRKRRFMMGNALVVNLVADMEQTLEKIFENE